MIIIKPDAFERRLVGQILTRFEGLGHLKRMCFSRMNLADCREHYAAHVDESFYPALVQHMTSGASLFIEIDCPWEPVRRMGELIRASLGVEGPRNLVHISDSAAADAAETRYWIDDCPSTEREILSISDHDRQELDSPMSRECRAIIQGEASELENVPQGAEAGRPGGDFY